MILTRSKEIEKCPNINCSSPICPLDPMTMKENCVWFPDEDICRKSFPPQWVKNQKKIKRKTKNVETYYTFKMIARNCVIAKGITGILPEGIGRTSIEIREKNWLKKHPAKRILTEEEKKVIGRRLNQGRRSR